MKPIFRLSITAACLAGSMLLGTAALEARQPQQTAGEPLTLRTALERALEHSPRLMVLRREIAVQDGHLRQAGVLPNPVLGFEADEFGGTGALAGTDALEYTVRLAQKIELGGKRSGRMKVARAGRSIAEARYRAGVLELAAEVRGAFAGLLAAQQYHELSREKVRLAREVHTTISERVSGGKVSPVELSRSGVILSAAEVETSRADARLTGARQHLAATWGEQTAGFGMARGELESLEEPETLDELMPLVENNPDLVLRDREMDMRRAERSLAGARAVPDLELGGGVKSFRESGNRAFVVELGLPLPLFDRNQGERAAADQALRRGESLLEQARAETARALVTAHSDLVASYNEAVSLRERVVGGSRRVFESIRLGYREGKFGYLELLDAQRTLFEARGGYIEALERYHRARALVDRLVGRGPENIEMTDMKENQSE